MFSARVRLPLLGCVCALVGPVAAAAGFDGVDAAGKPLMEQARKRIEEIRKGDFTIRLAKPDGSPVSGRATIRLLSHEFRFGANVTAVSAKLPEGSAVQAEALHVIEELFNFARVGNFWSHMAPQKDGPLDWQRVDRDVKWARERGLPMRFHCLIYNVADSLPRWYSEVKSTDEWWQLIEGRIRATAERYGTVIHEYDVINEMVLNASGARRQRPRFPALDDPQNGARILRLARKYLPDATLVSLEAGLVSRAESNKHFQDVLNYQRALLALDPPLDVIGYQGHFHSGGLPFSQGHPKAGPDAYKMRAISEGLDCLAALGKPLHITEFSGPSRSSKKGDEHQPGLTPEEVAAWVVNFYTLAFSKPYTREIIFWNVVDGVGGRAIDAGLLTKEGRKKPLYYALRKLLKEDWSSRWQGDLANGAARFRGFFGTYEITVEGYRPAQLTLVAFGKHEATVQLIPR